MKLGISTYSYTWNFGVPEHRPKNPWDSEKLINQALKWGISRVQIADNLPLHELSKEELERIRTITNNQPIQIEVGARGLTPAHLDFYLDIADFFSSPFLRFVIDGPEYQPGIEEVIEVIRDFLPKIEKKKIKLAIENHDRFKSEEFEYIIKNTSSTWIGICLDSVNSLGAGESYREVVNVLAPYTLNFHVKDFIVKRASHMMGFIVEGCPAGTGMLDIRWILKKLDFYKKCSSATLELWTPPADNLEETLRKEIIWADESLKYLKTLIE